MAFDVKRVIEEYTPKAYEIAFRLTGDRQEAWDLVQNSMIRVMKSYSTFDPSYTVDQWLYRIVRNLYIDRLRAESRRKEQPLDLAPEEEGRPLTDTLADPNPGPEPLMLLEEKRLTVQSALAALPLEQRMAVVLVDLEGYSYEEAAKMLDIPPSTLGVRVFRGRKTLKLRLNLLTEE